MKRRTVAVYVLVITVIIVLSKCVPSIRRNRAVRGEIAAHKGIDETALV